MNNIIENKNLTYSVLTDYVNRLYHSYDGLQVASCGKTLLGRDIYSLVLGKGDRNIVFVGGTHGVEWLTSLLLLKFTEKLLSEKTIKGFEVADLLERVKLIIIPELNPDGIEIALRGASACGKYKEMNFEISKGDFSRWSANARGVDINHNFNADWYTLREAEKKAGINAPAVGKYGGLYPESEPETAAVVKLCRNVEVSSLLTFHSQGEEIYYEYGNNTPEKSLSIAKIFSALSGYTLVKNEGLASSGGLKDWFIEEFGRPAFTIEIGKGKNPLPLEDIEKIYETLEGMMVVGMMV